MAHASVLEYYLENAATIGDRTAALVKTDGHYRAHTWQQLVDQSRQIAAVLVQAGVVAGDRVSIIAHTRLEWVTADMGIVWAGAVTVPIYPSNLADECQYIIADSGAVVVFSENAGQSAKFIAERARLPGLRRVIQIDGELPAGAGDWVVSLAAALAAAPVDAAVLEERRRGLNKDSMLTITYTSGTTGQPKGVVTTHDNMIYEAEAVAEINIMSESDVQMLFLPLAHVFARVAEVAWIRLRHVLAFAENMQTLRGNLQEVRPSLMAGVPRVFEKFYSAVVHRGQSAGGLRGRLFSQALRLSEKQGAAELIGEKLHGVDALAFAVLKKLVFAKVGRGLQEALGGNMRLMISGAAPLSPRIAFFFRDAGITLLEGFGLTETSAASCVNRLERNSIGSVGWPVPGTEMKLAEDGELMLRGRGIMRGYWGRPEATQEVLRDGWFYTGDIGQVQPDGSMRIIDRKKDIIVTAGGKKIAPQKLENLIKTAHLISQVVLHGDRRNFLTALITLDPEALRAWAEEHGLAAIDLTALSQHEAVLQAVAEVMAGFNAQLASYETVKKFKILDHDFSVENGELTASLKMKRRLIAERYRAVFDAFYDDQF